MKALKKVNESTGLRDVNESTGLRESKAPLLRGFLGQSKKKYERKSEAKAGIKYTEAQYK